MKKIPNILIVNSFFFARRWLSARIRCFVNENRIGVKSMVFHYGRASIPNLCSRVLTRQLAECRLLAIYYGLDVLSRVTPDRFRFWIALNAFDLPAKRCASAKL